jgi:gamma-glutamyltranspeptidase/glutathione hydrolase
MTPTIVTKGGKLYLVLGSPGGPTIINTVLETFLDVVDYGMDIQQAVAAPRFHHQWLPDKIDLEPGFSPDTMRLLQQRGHRLNRVPEDPDDGRYWGDAECIMIDQQTGQRLGGQDPRHSYGKAAGY